MKRILAIHVLINRLGALEKIKVHPLGKSLHPLCVPGIVLSGGNVAVNKNLCLSVVGVWFWAVQSEGTYKINTSESGGDESYSEK